MPEFILHIGPHKTGSSYLQSALAAMAEPLRAQGVLYPDDLGTKGHLELVRQLAEPAHHARLAAQIRRHLEAGFAKVIVTSEELARLQPPAIQALAEMLGGNPVRVVFYCRAWASVCASHWNQQVRQGLAVPMEEMIGRQLEHPRRSGTINYGKHLERWAGVFGREAINLVSLEGLAQAGIDTLPHFATHFLGLADPPAAAPVRRNSSMAAVDVEIVRALNQIKLERTGQQDSLIRRLYVKHKESLKLDAVVTAATHCQGTLRFDETAPRLERLHRSLFRAWGDRLVPPAPAQHFFTPRLHALAYIRSAYLTMPGVQAQLEESCRTLCGGAVM
jgi:hypothetical protein